MYLLLVGFELSAAGQGQRFNGGKKIKAPERTIGPFFYADRINKRLHQ